MPNFELRAHPENKNYALQCRAHRLHRQGSAIQSRAAAAIGEGISPHLSFVRVDDTMACRVALRDARQQRSGMGIMRLQTVPFDFTIALSFALSVRNSRPGNG